MLDPAAVRQAELNHQLELAARLHRAGKLSEEEHIAVQQRLSEASSGLTRNLGLQRAGWQQVGYNAQDVFVQYEMGTRLSTIFAQQSGQLAGAIQMIAQSSEGGSGKLSKFAGILAGPFGIALGVGLPLLAILVQSFLDTDSAADKAAGSTVDFSSTLTANRGAVTGYTAAINELEQATRGLINTQALLIDNSRTVAQASMSSLSAQLAALDRQIADAEKRSQSTVFNTILGDGGQQAKAEVVRLRRERATLQQQADTARAAYASAQTALEARNANDRADPKAAEQGAIERERARLQERRRYTVRMGNDVPMVGDGLSTISQADFEKEMQRLKKREIALGETGKKSNEAAAAAKRAAREQERLVQFGERAEDTIGRLNDQFNTAPKDIDRARQSVDQLDTVIADLEKRKPPGFQVLIDQAKAIKPLIADSLARPIRDMLGDQEREIELGKLRLAGRDADAEALQLTYQLMEKMGVESEGQLAVELEKRGIRGDEVRQLYDNLGLLRQQTREMRVQEELQQSWLSAVGGMRDNVRQTIRDLRTEGPKAIGEFFKRSMDVADDLFANILTEKLFGGLFRDLEDQVKGTDKVSRAGDKIAAAVDKASSSILSLGKSAAVASGQIGGGSSGESYVEKKTSDEENEITVTGLKDSFRKAYEGVFDEFNDDLSKMLTDCFGDIGIDLGSDIAATFGKSLAYMQLGSSVGGGLAGLLGLSGKGSQIGSQIGSAIGGAFLGPLGAIGGGFLGSVAGGLIKGKPMLGSTVVTSATESDPGAWGRLGGLENVKTVGSAVQGSLKQIASALGATLGDFAVSIGNVEWKGQSYYRVADEGRYDVGTAGYIDNGGPVLYDGTDADQAMRVALQNAIEDGAVGGLSAAVKKALSSSTDIEEGLSRALKVRDLEASLSGITSEIDKAFRDLEAQAAERVQLARDYGLDVLAVERRNGEERAALMDSLLQERTGSLQSLLDEMKFGSLAEGSASDRRQALLTQIATVRVDADAGKEGAADRLADLTRQLVESSRQNFGTAGGEYAADRASAVSAAEAVIKSEADRIKAAQDAALGTNARLDTANAVATEQTGLLGRIADAIEQVVAATGVSTEVVAPGLLDGIYREQAL
ncbi:MAG TPA: hypothetical protein VF463_08430 [Sphingobium sp.]